MGLPDIVIEFTKKAIATISVGTGGLVGIIVKDAKSNGSHVLKSVDSIPADLSADNKAYIERAFLGAPKAVHVFVLPAAAEDYTAAYKYFANKRINYICGDPAITPELATNLSTWVKGKRKAGKIHPVAVVPNVVANDKGTVNFCLVGGEKLSVGDTQYTPAQYCSRIAGLLAGLDLNVSATYKPLDEVTAIPEVEDDDTVDAAIDAGQLVLYDSGTGIVIGKNKNLIYVGQVLKLPGTKGFCVGCRVRVNKSATHYATGQKIASFVKGSEYKVIQVGSGKCLLGGIMSWVNNSDLTLL